MPNLATRDIVNEIPAAPPQDAAIHFENLLRFEDGRVVSQEHILAVANWDPKAAPEQEISFYPARVLLQDFTGVPAVADLAAMREALVSMGGDGERINPLQQADRASPQNDAASHDGGRHPPLGSSIASLRNRPTLRSMARYMIEPSAESHPSAMPSTSLVRMTRLMSKP